MEFSELPADILGLIFQKIDLDHLFYLLLLFPDKSHPVCRVIDTVRYSKVIVTNCWRQLLRLLPRAKKIATLDLLAHYSYVAIDEFLAYIPQWQAMMDPSVCIKKRLVFVLCCDLSNLAERYLVIRQFSKVLKCMPASVLNVTRQIFLFMSGLHLLLEKDHDEQVISLLFHSLENLAALYDSLESLSLVGPVSAHETGWISSPGAYDYTGFSRLSTVCLSNVGLVSLSGLSLLENTRHLVLSHNCIVSLKGVEFPAGLVTLDVSYNNLRDSLEAELPQLKVLNVRRNFLEKIMELPDSIEDLDISFNELPSTMFRIPASLKVLQTDIAQFYLMSEKVQGKLRQQQVCIRKNIASHTNQTIFGQV